MKRVIAFCLCCVCLLVNFTRVNAQGFKGKFGGKTEVELKRKLAPFVAIKNKRIKLIATVQGNAPKEIAEILLTKLRTDVQKDTGFIEEERNPETILRFTVTAYDNEHNAGTRRDDDSAQAYTSISANIEVSYQAIEVKTNAPVDSENLTSKFNQKYVTASTSKNSGGNKSGIIGTLIDGIGRGSNAEVSKEVPPTKSAVQSLLLQDIVRKMSSRAAPSEERFPVLLPRGKFEPISDIALTRAWMKVIEAATKMPPLPKADDDSYRYYLIGLANEGLAYERETVVKTREYLFEARKGYDKAREMNRKEKEFTAPWTRVDEALKQYEKILKNDRDYQQALLNKGDGSKEPTGGQPVIGKSDKQEQPKNLGKIDTWNNEAIITLWQSGNVTEEELIDFVKNAPTHKFDPFSLQGAMDLKTAKVPASVIDAMRKRSSGKKTPAPTTKTPLSRKPRR